MMERMVGRSSVCGSKRPISLSFFRIVVIEDFFGTWPLLLRPCRGHHFLRYPHLRGPHPRHSSRYYAELLQLAAGTGELPPLIFGTAELLLLVLGTVPATILLLNWGIHHRRFREDRLDRPRQLRRRRA